MTWTILVLIIGIALYIAAKPLFGMVGDAKKPMRPAMHIAKKLVKVLAIILIAGATCRLYMPHYLTNINPMILQEMAQNMQTVGQEETNKAIRKYVRSNMDDMIANAPVLGNVDAEKTIFLWSDYSCPYCRRVHGELMKVIAERDDVRVVIKEFSIHGPLSDAPAKATIAAKMQGIPAAAALSVKLMENQYFTQDDMKDQAKLGSIVHKNVMKFAKEVGLDVKKLETDMESATVAKELAQVRELAQRFQINGTPFLIVGDKAFPGAIPADQIKEALK